MKNNLRIERAKKGVNQTTVAKALGISQQVYSNIETDSVTPSLENIEKISKYFKKSAIEIFPELKKILRNNTS